MVAGSGPVTSLVVMRRPYDMHVKRQNGITGRSLTAQTDYEGGIAWRIWLSTSRSTPLSRSD